MKPRRDSTKTVSSHASRSCGTQRSLTIREDVHGMVHLHARLDPESAAPVKAAIEALVSDALRRASADLR